MKKRRGIIKISRNLLLDNPDFELLKLVFSNFIPIKSDTNNDYSIIQFYGYSNFFDEVEEWEVTNYYDVIIKTINQARIIEFKKIEK